MSVNQVPFRPIQRLAKGNKEINPGFATVTTIQLIGGRNVLKKMPLTYDSQLIANYL
jgi:hypothetical protein